MSLAAISSCNLKGGSQPRGPGHKPLEKGIIEGEKPVYDLVFAVFDRFPIESTRLGFLVKDGW